MSKDNITDSLLEAIKERVSSPLWGYIILSWFGFNWQNVAILFMSKASINTRIEQIMAHEWFYTHFLFAPLVVGTLLAILSPYFQWILYILQGWAKDWHRTANNAFLSKEYQATIAMADARAEVENADELARARAELEVEKVHQAIKQESINTQSLLEEQDKLNASLDELRSRVSELQERRKSLYLQIDSMVMNAVAIRDLIEKAQKGETDMEDVKDEINRTISPTLLSEALDRLVNKKESEDLTNV
ncbi:TPA: hypothetical protein U2Q93_000270 [Enterobacter sichuanensis]|nr:hypothetical protein [Enterobacter sichuanensis]HEM8742650.1 hypothetical protein [Enterobacter sichuanensis]